MTQRFRGIIPALVIVCVYSICVVPARADASPRIARAVVDYTAHTLTVSVANLGDQAHGILAPRAWLGAVPLTVNTVTMNAATQTGTLTLALPDPIPVGSFLLQVTSDEDDEDGGLTFEVALGVRGPVGAQGLQGLMGPVGPAGPTGAPGVQGGKGETGALGLQGVQGPKGDTGAGWASYLEMPGANCATGGLRLVVTRNGIESTDPNETKYICTGDRGLTGATGPGGPLGPVGPMGPQGPTGAQGLQGSKGDTGIAGAKGDKGDSFTFRGGWDASASYRMNDVVTTHGSAYVATADSIATDPGTDTVGSSWVLLAARGITGTTGDPGIQGSPGVDGRPGPKGDVGPQGPSGVPGAAGSTLVGATNWFLAGGSWSIPTNALTVLPGSSFTGITTGGPLEIAVTIGGTFLQALNQFSCMPVVDGGWVGRFAFGAAFQASLPYVEGIEYNGTADVLVVTWSRSRVYSGIPAGTHAFEVRCWATGGVNSPLVGDFAVHSLTVKEIR
jgi:Collagen triple helix repeat (20 copies)